MKVLIYGTIKIESLHSLQCANYHRKYDKSNDNCNYEFNEKYSKHFLQSIHLEYALNKK